MQRNNLLAGTALALIMCAVPALAQQRGEEKSSPAQAQSESKEQGKQQKSESKEQGKQQKSTSESRSAPKEKSAQGGAQSEGKEKGAQTRERDQGQKGTAQGPGKDQEKKGSAQRESREKDGKGTAQGPAKDKDKGSAQAPSSKDKSTAETPKGMDKDKGTARAPGKEQDKAGSRQAEPKDRDKDSAQKQPKDGGAQKSTERQGSRERVQLSEEQRTNVHQTLIKESNLNRATNVNVSVSVGTRIPRSVHLAPLPGSIISVVPAFRSYQYVVVNDEICIVDPNSFEIVEVIAAPGGRTARTDSRQGHTALMLTEEEKAIVLRSVESDRGSTLALGSLNEGSSVPRGANVQPFPDRVVQQVPKLKDHKYFAAENRVAIVDSQGDKVQLVLEDKDKR
jgi:hypothetical protein